MIALLRISAFLASVVGVGAAAGDPIVRRAKVPKGLQLQRSLRHDDKQLSKTITPAGRVKNVGRKNLAVQKFWPFGDTCTDSQIGGTYVDSAKNQAFVLNQTDCAISFTFGGNTVHNGTVYKDTTGTTVTVDDWGFNGTVLTNGNVQFSDSNGEATRHWTKTSKATAGGAGSAATTTTADATAATTTTADATAATTAVATATTAATVTTPDASIATTAAASAVTTAAATDQTALTTIIPIVVPVVPTPPNSVPIQWASVPVATAAPDGTPTEAPDGTATTAAPGEGEGEGEGGGWFFR